MNAVEHAKTWLSRHHRTGTPCACDVCVFARAVVDLDANRLSAAKLEEFRQTACDACQIFDGWHGDGTAWTAWDEEVRLRLSKMLAEITDARDAAREEQP